MRIASLALALSLLPLSIACGDKDDGGDDSGVTGDDGDGGGDTGTVTDPDADEDGYPESEDCDDADPAVNPGATELCDGVDNDCDGLVDADDDTVADAGSWYSDDDGDGYGDEIVIACEQPEDGVELSGDCDDADPEISPAADEVCDDVDNDCDSLVDDEDDVVVGAPTWYLDLDGDTFGDPDVSVEACVPPGETGDYVADDQDCDDDDEAINPDAEEVCDGVDNDCDGILDPESGCGGDCADWSIITYYDSYSDPAPPAQAAADSIGMAYADGVATDFGTLWAADSYDILLVDVPGSGLPEDVVTAVEEQLAGGGYVVFSWWQLYNDADMQALLEVDATTSISAPEDLHSLDSGLFDLYEAVPDPMVADGDEAGINGSYLVATDADTSEPLAWFDETGTNVSILSTLDGQVLLNGFLPWDYKSGDNDTDGMVDASELYVNELIWLSDCAP